MPTVFYLLTSFLMTVTAISVQFLNFIAYFVLVATVSLDGWQCHILFQNVWLKQWAVMKQTFIHEHLLIVCGEAGIEEAEMGGAALHEKSAEWTYLHCSDASIHWVD